MQKEMDCAYAGLQKRSCQSIVTFLRAQSAENANETLQEHSHHLLVVEHFGG
jgi:hypothetical protein